MVEEGDDGGGDGGRGDYDNHDDCDGGGGGLCVMAECYNVIFIFRRIFTRNRLLLLLLCQVRPP